jgi:hypothetical protein
VVDATRNHHSDKSPQTLAKSLKFAAVCVLFSIILPVTNWASAPSTSTVTLTWEASPDTNVTGYKIYYGTASGVYTQTASPDTVTQATIAGLTPGVTYFFVATALDVSGLESDYSPECAFAMPALLPELSLSRAGTSFVLRWSTNCPDYTLQWSSALQQNNGFVDGWTDLTSSPATSGSYFTYTDTTAAARRYYRLKK